MQQLIFVFPTYLAWHYTKGIKEFWHVWYKLECFVFRFFSINLLLKTFSAPFERLDENYKKGINVEDFVSTFIVNSIMRVVGMIMRSFLIIFALVILFLGVLASVILFIIWLVLPIFSAGLMILGVLYLFKFI